MTTETQDRPATRRKQPWRMPPAPVPAADALSAAPITSFALIVGAMKAGTTSLYHYLAAHPEIAACPKKEPDFFSSGRNWRLGPEAYDALWPDFDPARHRYALEASTNYAKHPQRKRVPQRIQEFAERRGARFKLIYILRDPIDRIESHLAHNIAWRQRAHEVGPGQIESAVAVSSYALQIRRFLRCFPRKDLLVLDFDELRADPRALVGRACDFLGLEPPADLEVRPPANPRRDAHGSAEFRLDAGQRAALRDALRADVTELRDRFGVDVAKWDIL